MSNAHQPSAEQQLINELIRMIAKMGGTPVMKDLIARVDRDGDPCHWTPQEIRDAYDLVKWQNAYIGQADILAIIGALAEKYNIDLEDTTLVKKGRK